MNFRAISIYIGHLIVVESLCMLPALAIAGQNGEQNVVRAFAIIILGLFCLGLPLARIKKRQKGVYAREGFVTVALGWVLISFFGALPFWVSGEIPRFIDAWFETVSGFTTTGASVLADVESFPRGLLYWRSFTHWLGGMGVLVFILAISSLSKGSGETIQLLRAETPGPAVGKLAPTIKQSARVLYTIYISLTILEIILLLCGGMPVFDSFCHAFATAGTGGFSVKNQSIGAYNSLYIEMVISIFVLLFGTNFGIFYMLLLKQFKSAFKNEELRLYLGIVAVSVLMISIDTYKTYYPTYGEALRKSFFQVASIITTTGFNTADFDRWPQLARYLLVMLMWGGACAGSTAGGVKISRALLMWKSLRSQLQVMLRPRALRPVRVEGKTVPEDILRGVHAYLIAYVFIALFSILLVTVDNVSMETYVTAAITCLSNSGPGLDRVGPFGNFAFFSDWSKFVFSINMLVGRLEIFPMLLLFSPNTWRRQA